MRVVVISTILFVGCSFDNHKPDTDGGPTVKGDTLQIDQECLTGSSKCDGEGGLKYCVDGRWTVEDCEDLCSRSGGQAIGCGPNGANDICICLPHAGFWEVCGDRKCGLGLICRMYTLHQGVCTRQCCEMKGMPCAFPSCPTGFWCGMGLCERN